MILDIQYNAFLDRKNVKDTLGKKTAKQFKRFGHLAQQKIRGSMKKAPAKFTKSGKRKKLSKYEQQKKYQRGKNKGKKRWVKGKHSAPGRPPYYRPSQHINLRSIFFFMNRSGDAGFLRRKNASVIVHTAAKTGRASNQVAGSPTPLLHEHGGSATFIYRKRRTTAQIESKTRNTNSTNRVKARFPKRPYMNPGGKLAVKVWKKNLKKYANR